VKALFIVDDRPEAGLGHVVRCGALADELRERGWACLGGTLDARTRDHVDVVVMDAPRDAPRQYSREPLVPDDRFKLVVIRDVPLRQDDADLLVCGSAGATPEMFKDCGAKRVLAGPGYSLLRPEFRAARWRQYSHPWEPLDLTSVDGASASELAIAIGVSGGVITYGGMRLMEALCVGAPILKVIARNPGEELNVQGWKAGVEVDGWGCRRVADAIEAMFQ
jgi:spore coat polysaccharide biosynthesis predicted glycosyltransferase SpsG